MVRLKKISLPEVREGIAIAYEGDQELFDKYHIGQCDHFSATIQTMQMLREASSAYDLSYYKVIYDKKPIGYIVTFDDFLYSFGINRKYRKKDILIEWWSEIKRILGKRFFSMLYNNNTRAIDHLVKQGMKIMEINETENTTLFVYES